MFDLIKNLKSSSIRAMASNGFVTSMANVDSETLQERKVIIQNKEDKNDIKYKITFEQGFYLLQKFSEKTEPDPQFLKLAAEKFFDSIEIKKNQAEPYFYLSYIFNYFGKKEQALNYLKVATNINPNIEGKDLIIKQISEVEHKTNKDHSESKEHDLKNQTQLVQNNIHVEGEVKFKPEAVVVRRFPTYPKY